MLMPKTPIEYANQIYPGQVGVQKPASVRLQKAAGLVGSNNQVLDVGCADGTFGELLIKNGNRVYGIEGSKSAAVLAQKKGLIVNTSDIESGFNFEDNFFDVVFAGEIIEHLIDTEFFLDEIRRVLKPNGWVILTTPNAASLGKRLLLLFGKNPFYEASLGYPPNASPGHLRFFTKGLLCDFLRYKNFSIFKIEADVVHFSSSGNTYSKKLADLFPTFGSCFIVKARVNKVGKI
jgi:SAM-dependent methyltransferase